MPEPGFPDHFSSVAADYARFRPRYPAALLRYLADLALGRSLAWDCATGNGQAAVGLAELFDRVVATDASADQVAHAIPHPKVEYRVARAEACGLPPASVDLVTVAQALHWFDLDAFYAEVRRVLGPGGVLAVWCYGRFEADNPQVVAALERFYHETVGPYWPAERRLVEEGYRSLPFPFAELAPPAFEMTGELPLGGLAGHLGTWSAVKRFREATGRDPLPELLEEFAAAEPAGTYRVRWPIALRVGRLHAGEAQR